MEETNTPELILEEWIANLSSRDRGRQHVSANFDELFEKLASIHTPFDVAHAILPKAIKAHQPKPQIVRSFYKGIKGQIDKSEKEFTDDWNTSIKDKGTESFFTFFKIKTEDEDSDPKVFGNMSVREYRTQRKYADSFPTLNTDELERRLHDRMYNIENDLENVLGDLDGESD